MRRTTLLATAAIALLLALAPGAQALTSTLVTGQTLSPGQTMVSPDHHYWLGLQNNGNLVLGQNELGGGTRTLWSSGTAGDTGDHALLESNGNLALFDASGNALWSANTSHPGCTNLTLGDDGNLVLSSSAGAYWSTGTVVSTLEPDNQLANGRRIFSPNGAYELLMEDTGDLVIYDTRALVWSAGSTGTFNAHLDMQPDGNLVVDNGSGTASWATGTAGHNGASATLQNNGNLELVSPTGALLWQSGSGAARTGLGPALRPPTLQPCPAPTTRPPSGSGTPTGPVVLVPSPTTLPVHGRVKVRIVFGWTWIHRHSRIRQVTIRRLPRGATMTVTCTGRGCPWRVRRAGARTLKRLIRALEARDFHAGDLLLVTVSRPGYASEQGKIAIRDGRKPLVLGRR